MRTAAESAEPVPTQAAVLPSMRGRHRAAGYFLWPTHQQDATGDQAGMVPQRSFFVCMEAMEAAGLPTRFPHPSQLYRSLLSKEWQPDVCLMPKLRVPPSVTLNRGDLVRGGAHRAARRTLDALVTSTVGDTAPRAPTSYQLRSGNWEASLSAAIGAAPRAGPCEGRVGTVTAGAFTAGATTAVATTAWRPWSRGLTACLLDCLTA